MLCTSTLPDGTPVEPGMCIEVDDDNIYINGRTMGEAFWKTCNVGRLGTNVTRAAGHFARDIATKNRRFFTTKWDTWVSGLPVHPATGPSCRTGRRPTVP